MPKRRYEATLLARSSYWLSEALIYGVRLQAELAVIDASRRNEVRSRNIDKVIDAELRLALALEAYGEILKGGDLRSAEECVDELEIPVWVDRKPNVRQEYVDPVEQRDIRRSMARDLNWKQKRLAKLVAAGATGPEVRELAREIKAKERFGEESS